MENNILLSIDDMLDQVPEIRSELISIGYEQSDHNDDRSVDFDDAVRMFFERRYMWIARESLDLFATIIRIKCRSSWEREFPDNVADFYYPKWYPYKAKG